MLSSNTTITSLNLESNSIATAGIEALAGAIAKNGKVGSQRLPAAATPPHLTSFGRPRTGSVRAVGSGPGSMISSSCPAPATWHGAKGG